MPKSKHTISFSDSLVDAESYNDTIISLGLENLVWPSKKDKTEQNLKRKHSLINDASMGNFSPFLIQILVFILPYRLCKTFYFIQKTLTNNTKFNFCKIRCFSFKFAIKFGFFLFQNTRTLKKTSYTEKIKS